MSVRGAQETCDCMRLNAVLGQIVPHYPDTLTEWMYRFSVFGAPSFDQPWGWQWPGTTWTCLAGRLLALCLYLEHQLPPDAYRIGAEPGKDLGGSALSFLGEGQQDVHGADVVVAEPQRLVQRQFECRLGARRERNVPGRPRSPRPMISSTCCRAASRLMPSDPSALAAMPSPSRTRPSRMCSVPT
jgi:hypothetical protein